MLLISISSLLIELDEIQHIVIKLVEIVRRESDPTIIKLDQAHTSSHCHNSHLLFFYQQVQRFIK